MQGSEIISTLYKQGYVAEPKFYNSEFSNLEKFFLVFLNQNAKWNNVLKALSNLKEINSIEQVAQLKVSELSELIKPSGFYNTKANTISNLSKAIINNFDSLDDFIFNCSFEWLLEQKGVGIESAASILNNLSHKEYFVIDANVKRLLNALNYELIDYEQAHSTITSGLDSQYFYDIFQTNELAYIYAKSNSIINEFCAKHYKGKKFDDSINELLKVLF